MEQKRDAEREFVGTAYRLREMTRLIPGPQDPHALAAPDDLQNALEAVEATQVKLRPFEKEYSLIEMGHAFYSPLFDTPDRLERYGHVAAEISRRTTR